MMNGLQSHNLLLDDNRTKESLKLENDACEQLALDLCMSSHVFASKAFSKPDPMPQGQAQTFEDEVANMSLATGALSIDTSGPPPVHFGFLTPIAAAPTDHESSDMGPAKSSIPQTGEMDLIPMGVRLLIDEWKVGEDPKDYKYLDPYGDEASSPVEPKDGLGVGSFATKNIQSRPTDLSSLLNPPTVGTARAPPLVAPSTTTVLKAREKTLLGVGITQSDSLQAQGSSQDVMMVSTQVEPGRFGDRKGQKKRQKRVGGF
jgi:hypothetical protein